MWQARMQVGNLPFQLSLLQDGSAVLQKLAQFRGIIDIDDKGTPEACFWSDTFVFNDDTSPEELSYGVAYHLELYPKFKNWLSKQNLDTPI